LILFLIYLQIIVNFNEGMASYKAEQDRLMRLMKEIVTDEEQEEEIYDEMSEDEEDMVEEREDSDSEQAISTSEDDTENNANAVEGPFFSGKR
jgi:hypothetical protein